jgi:hypothetical protein
LPSKTLKYIEKVSLRKAKSEQYGEKNIFRERKTFKR